ncbi:hypothetical protein GEMRC1_013988 [Eukaryota sp. GEM-RC1]
MSSADVVAIDLGSSRLRLGWAGQQHPQINCASYISKVRAKGVLVGDLALEQHNARSPFDGLLCTSFEFLETLLDNTLSTLSPLTPPSIAMTETIANPWVLRQPLLELLFEGYQSPFVSLSVDALTAHHAVTQFIPQNSSFSTGILVHIGNRATYTIPITSSGPDMSLCKRIPVGGEQMTSYLGELVSSRNPQFSSCYSLFFEQLKNSTHSLLLTSTKLSNTTLTQTLNLDD